MIPAIIAALGGIRFQSECQRLAERSAVMHVMLAGRMPYVPPAKRTPWQKLRQQCIDFFTTCWLVLRHLIGRPPPPEPVALIGGRWGDASKLATRIAEDQAKAAEENIGSWTHNALRLTELVATDFVQEAAEWSVLYAKEVSDPG